MIEQVEKEIDKLMDELHYPLAKEWYARLSGGKRLRAKLVLKIAQSSKLSIRLAAIIEMIHAASLLHDDVIDDAMSRRGVASINATEGSKQAIMLGDILYSKAFSALSTFEDEIAKCVADAVTALSMGEMMDVEMSKSFNSNEKRYLDMLYLKTASLIEASAKAAAMLVGKDADAYGLYGKNLGLSFQIIDDILDIVSDEATLGKPALNDYVEGKCTLPYIYMYNHLESNDREKLLLLHGKKLTSDESAWVKEKMESLGALKASYHLAQNLSDEAKAAVEDEALHTILDTMMQRTF